MFDGELIDLHWRCHADPGQSSTLLPEGEESQKWKFKVIQGLETKQWLHKFIQEQADRDEIMWPGSSNINESIHNVYARKADKRYDFRFVKLRIFSQFFFIFSNCLLTILCLYRASYAARVDVAVVQHALGSKTALYQKICEEFVMLPADDKTKQILERWDSNRSKAAAQAATAEGKAKRAAKKARKSQLLQRKALRAGAYTYITVEERAGKLEVDANTPEAETKEDITAAPESNEDVSDSDSETD